MGTGLAKHFPHAKSVQGIGGSSYWVRLNDEAGVDTDQLAKVAFDHGILIEPGSVYFSENDDRNSFRLGFSSIHHSKIEPGLELLANLSLNMPKE